nr:hypothetical protein [Micromonospora sp. RTGN7]
MSGKPAGTTDAAATTTPVRQRPATDSAPPRPADEATAWTEYVAAARQLDGVRRSAATAATEQARAVRAAREELTTVRERLAPQRSRLRERGVPPMVLVPSPPELTEAARSMVGGPTAVLTALRAARGWADASDGALAARGPFRPTAWPPRLRNLLVYGPLALVVPLLQVALFVADGTGPASVVAVLLGVPMPVAAFVAGWLAVGRLFGGTDGPAAPGPDLQTAGPRTTAPRLTGRQTPRPRTTDAGVGGPGPVDDSRDGTIGSTSSAPAAGAGVPFGGTADGPVGASLTAVPAGGGPAGASDGLVPDPATGHPVDRTPRWGALVCLVPAVSTTAGLVLMMLAG